MIFVASQITIERALKRYLFGPSTAFHCHTRFSEKNQPSGRKKPRNTDFCDLDLI